MASYSEDLHSAALAYHRLPRPGKLAIQAIKPLANQRDLALAYSPGVAAACMAIAADPAEAASLTIRANLVAVVSNGTAVLGLGNIGPLASKPVMEGKAVLFKKFAGINLEDIRGPECFEIEAQLKERMKIPVFHDDQHGTAIIVGAAITNALLLNGKKLADIKIVCSGAGADIFLGVSAPNVLTPDMVKSMADQPLVMALANPNPEIMPDEARKARPDAMICTGRSDFPNQVNNVLCFPFIFRGALDVGATAIN